MVNTVQVNVDHGHNFNPLVDYIIVKKFHQG